MLLKCIASVYFLMYLGVHLREIMSFLWQVDNLKTTYNKDHWVTSCLYCAEINALTPISHEISSSLTSILAALWHLTSRWDGTSHAIKHWPSNYLHAWTWAFVWRSSGCGNRSPPSTLGGRTQQWCAPWYTSGQAHIPPPSWILGLSVKE